MTDLNELKRLHAAATQVKGTGWIAPEVQFQHAIDNAFPALAAELEELRRENDSLRFRLAHGSADCVYCHLPAADMGKCERGFPGCARADDMMAAPMIDRAAIRSEAFREAAEWFTLRKDVRMILTTLADAEDAKR